LLAGPAGGLRRVSISHLLTAPGTRVSESPAADSGLDAGTVLSSLDSAELARLRERVAHVLEACTGYRHGSPALALPGEPRPEYAPEGGADARWLAMARTVLAEHTDASTPTQDLVLARITARLDAEHGAGAVPVPGRTRARALLREISKGTSAFGGTKA